MPISFEAKKHAWRQTQDGIVLSVTIHPSDMSAELAASPLGTRYMVALAQIGDDEKPIELVQSGDVVACGPDENANGKREGLDSAPAKRKFEELSLSQQSALRCSDDSFKWFLMDRYPEYSARSHGDTAQLVRFLCGVQSRSEFDTSEMLGTKWKVIEENYQSWLTDARYSGSKR